MPFRKRLRTLIIFNGKLKGGLDRILAIRSGSPSRIKASSNITQTRFSPIALCVSTAHVVLSTPPETATNALSLPMLFLNSSIWASTNLFGLNVSNFNSPPFKLSTDLRFHDLSICHPAAFLEHQEPCLSLPSERDFQVRGNL